MNTTECLEQLNNKGFYCFENLLNNNELKTLTELVREKLEENKNKYFFLADKNLNDTVVNSNNFILKFHELFENLSSKLNLANFQEQKIYKVLRVVTGNKNEKESYRYHFDAHLFTVLIPIIMPNRKNKNVQNEHPLYQI